MNDLSLDLVRLLIAVVAVGGAVLCGRSAALWALEAMRMVRAVRRSREGGLGPFTPGPAVVVGRVSSIDVIDSQVSGRSAVYLATDVDRWEEGPTTLGHAGKWVRVSHTEEATPFEVTDGESVLLVDPEGAEVLAPVAVRRGRDDQTMMRYQEGAIEPGDEIMVSGVIREEGGFAPSATYRGTTMRPVLGSSARRQLLIATRHETRKRIAARLALAAGGFAGLVVLALTALGAIRKIFG
jgi:hypothetical protein